MSFHSSRIIQFGVLNSQTAPNRNTRYETAFVRRKKKKNTKKNEHRNQTKKHLCPTLLFSYCSAFPASLWRGVSSASLGGTPASGGMVQPGSPGAALSLQLCQKHQMGKCLSWTVSLVCGAGSALAVPWQWLLCWQQGLGSGRAFSCFLLL